MPSVTEFVTEREIKVAARAGFVLPDFDGVLEGISAAPITRRDLDAVYYDTADLRLARWGVTLRWRAGDGTGWTVKLPEGEAGGALVRREVTFAGTASTIPDEALELVRALARREPLQPVAHLRTRREGVELRDVEGHHVAEVVDDEVTVLEGERVAARHREVEVELDRRAPEELGGAVVAALRRAGAGEPELVPKVVRALGPRALAPPDLEPVQVGDDPQAGELVRAAIVASVLRLLRHDPGVRVGDDPEDVHQARVATRRLRSDLRTFRPLLDRRWARELRAELQWLGRQLGAVRDPEVLLHRLRSQAGDLPDVDAASLAPLLRRLADVRERARAALLDSMRSDRYVALLERLVAAGQSPLLLPEAAEPARRVVPDLVARPWKHLAKAVAELDDDPPDADLHRVRILAKRARYASEAVAPAIGKPARRLGSKLARLQDVLGEHQDAVVAEAWLREGAADADAAEAFAAGELVAVQRADAAATRAAWPKAWAKVDRKKLRSWMS